MRSELRRGRHVNTGTDESSRPEPCVIMTPTYHRRRRGQTAHKSRKPAGIRASFRFMLVCTINFTAGGFTRVCVLLLGSKTHGRDTYSRPGLGSSHTPSIPCPLIGLAVPARPHQAQKGPRVGVPPHRSSILSGREDCWLLPGRSWLRLGTLASALLPGVTFMSLSPAPFPA